MLTRATPWSLAAGPSPVGPPGGASPGGCPGCGAPAGGPACGFCVACGVPPSSGALGCSEGPFPSSVVCARTLTHQAPISAKATIAKPAKNLLFMLGLFRPILTYSLYNQIHKTSGCYSRKQPPCQSTITALALSPLFSTLNRACRSSTGFKCGWFGRLQPKAVVFSQWFGRREASGSLRQSWSTGLRSPFPGLRCVPNGVYRDPLAHHPVEDQIGSTANHQFANSRLTSGPA